MPNNHMTMPTNDSSDQALALWMLERIRDSDRFLGVIKAARADGNRDVLDTPDYTARHQERLKKLYQSDTEDETPISSATAAKIEALLKRDLLSSKEELLEKALAAYLEQHPEGGKDLPSDWQTTFEAAQAEIEGRTSGAFEPGFTAGLAAAARQELSRQNETEKTRDVGLERE